MAALPPRVATLVMCTETGEMLGKLAPFETSAPWWPDAADLVRWVRQSHGVDVTVLRLLHAARSSSPGGDVTYLVEVDRVAARSLPLRPWEGQLDHHPLRLPYAEPGGPGRDLAWATAELARLGYRQSGPPHQQRTWNLSSVWRIPIVGGAVWLKCVPPFFAHEGAILARLQGAPVPRLLAHQAARIVMDEIPGEDQYGAGLPVLLELVDMLVRLQGEWVTGVVELLGLGLPDWRADALARAVESVVRRTAPDLPDGDRRSLDGLVEGLPRRFAQLEECGIPDTLVHGDFAPGNARGDGRRLVLLDWGDCGVGNPLLDQSAFLDRTPADLAPEVAAHWHEAWRRVVPGSNPQRAAELLAPVAAARQAVIYRTFLDNIEPSEHPYHRGDPALWLTRAAHLTSGAASTS